MKIFFTFFLLIASFISKAQWSNTTNQFYDSLHMPVCTAIGNQTHSMSITSYPDSGTIVFWEDERNGLYAKKQIYAQKYDKNGNQLWVQNGIAISSGTNNQHFYSSTNHYYRNYSYAATDSAGGFYLAYIDDSISTYAWHRICVQHIKADGSLVFPGAGWVRVQTPEGSSYNFTYQQLIADGNKGFFLSFAKVWNSGVTDIYAASFRDENGIMKRYGGGQVDVNYYNHTVGVCNQLVIDYREADVSSYMIYSDLQNGCNIVMVYYQNANLVGDGNNRFLVGYNKLIRVKKDCRVIHVGDINNPDESFKKDSVMVYYNEVIRMPRPKIICGQVELEHYFLDGNGIKTLTFPLFNASYVKGVEIATDGNININVVSIVQRDYINGGLTSWFTRLLYQKDEKYDSIPYAYTIQPYVPMTQISGPKPGLDKIGSNVDTLFYGNAPYDYESSFKASKNIVYSAALITETGGKKVRLQQLKMERKSADSFALKLNTPSEYGVVIGKEVSTGFSGTDIFYGNPQILTDGMGGGVFYILETGEATRVSPIINGSELAWGAMGKPIGSGSFNGSYFQQVDPYMSFVPNKGAVVSWDDGRAFPLNSRENIWMRHIDNVSLADYTPPVHKVKLIPNPYGASFVNPSVLLGSSKQFTVLEFSNANISLTPVMAILDNYNLGIITAKVYENTGAIRAYNGSPYLNRNYLIKPENDPSGTPIHVRLYFANEEFDALKTADPTILDPGMLTVVKQPNAGTITPGTYVPAGGEEVITPIAWKAVPGGYYVEIVVSSFSNFFIQGVNGALPLTWLNIKAKWKGNANAKVSWQVTAQTNVKKYNLQHSDDGVQFVNVCEVAATNSENYNCTVPAEKGRVHYYRVLQTDNDGRSSLSKVVRLATLVAQPVAIYPNPVINEMQVTGLSNYREYIIVNVEGEAIMREKLTAVTKSISVKHLQAGTYILKLIGDTEAQTLKFIKK